MTKPVQLFCWHFMSYPYLPADFDEKYDTGWITVPNALWDREKSRGLLNEYIDQLAYADTLGFDGMVLNEHHQNVYGLMPSPNIIASALSQKTSKGKIVVLANLLPLHGNPLRVAEEYAMVDNMSDGRVIAGFAPGGGQETFNYNTPAAIQREQFWEAVELIHQAWTRPGPFTFEGKDSGLPIARNNAADRKTWILLLPVVPRARRRHRTGATGIREDPGRCRQQV
jgi:alkanesulfonate monooxygenase SsuD/methylene tetrahydromethanopterin reductase-like flavin-dependent oxidoreductase (luciferase family)